MVTDKIRIRKDLQPKVSQWSTALEISESEFVRDALRFYIRHLEGKAPYLLPNVQLDQETVEHVGSSESSESSEHAGSSEDIGETDDVEDFTGSIEF
jgi:hypothetical protein